MSGWHIPGLVGVVALALVVSCIGRSPETANTPIVSSPSSSKPDAPPPAPHLGQVVIGAYAAEAAAFAGLPASSIESFGDPAAYRRYRQSVRQIYGADLEDMNYFGIGTPGWTSRLPRLQSWLISAGRFGTVTVALEPLGKEGLAIFRDSPEMQALRSVFDAARTHKVDVYVRFASEANLKSSPYSAFGPRAKGIGFYNRAKWFRNYMPLNVKVVFSPLINTVIAKQILPLSLMHRMQYQTIRWMFAGDGSDSETQRPWDRVGGTLYRTDLELVKTYDAYYRYFTRLAPKTPFQLCELGGPQSARKETLAFLKAAGDGRWPLLIKVNLFARNINTRADPQGDFGFIDHADGALDSWLKPHIEAGHILPELIR